MSNTHKAIAAAIAGLVALGAANHADARKMPAETEKCAGIAKAGGNDCGTSFGGCHGSAKVDSNEEAWIEMPKGLCERIVGGHVTTSPYAIPGGKEAYEASLKKAQK